MRNMEILIFGVTYTRGFTVVYPVSVNGNLEAGDVL